MTDNMSTSETIKRQPPDNANRKNWGTFAKNSTARSQENTLQIAGWVYKFGYVSNEIIQRVLGISRMGIGNELCKKGVLEKVKTKPGFRDRHVFILTQSGVRLIERLIDTEETTIWGGFIPVKYTLHKTKRIKFLTLEHDLLTQHVLLDIHAAGPDREERLAPTSVYSGRELQSATGGEKDTPAFDAEIYGHAQVEVELNHKSEERMRQWLYSRAIYLNKNIDYVTNTHIYIFTDQNSIIDAISELLAEDYAKKVVHGKANKLIIEPPTNANPLDPLADLTSARKMITMQKLAVDKERKSGGYRISNSGLFREIEINPTM